MRYLFQILVALSLFSCNQTRNSINQEHKISIDFNASLCDSDKFLSLIDSVSFVSLEDSKDYLIGFISKAVIDNDYLYLHDAKTQSIYKYNKSGKAIYKIHNIGRGPGEYISISDFVVKDNKVYIRDIETQKILVYNNGVFNNEFKLDIWFENFGIIDNKHLALYIANETKTAQGYNVCIYNIDKKVIEKKLMKIPKYEANSSISHTGFSNIGKGLYFKNIFDNYIYSITKDTAVMKYYLDFGKYNIDLQSICEKRNKYKNESNLILWLYRENSVSLIDNFSETNNYLYFSFAKNRKFYKAYHNKSKKQSYIFDDSKFKGELEKLFNTPKYSDCKYFLFVQYDNEIIDSIQKQLSSKGIKTSFVNFDKENNDNPYIMFTFFKK